MITNVEIEKNTQTRSLYLPREGVVVELPSDCSLGIDICPDTGTVKIDPIVRARLNMITHDTILANRYPTREHGERFMEQISPQWRDRLFDQAKIVTQTVINSCQSIDQERIAVILFGSVAKNLVKPPTHPDPSNIDLAVIGFFSKTEKDQLLGLVKPVRRAVTEYINAVESREIKEGESFEEKKIIVADPVIKCEPVDDSSMPNQSLVGCRVGVFFQTPETVRCNGYDVAREYVTSCAKALHDPYYIWREIEHEAIAYGQLPSKIKRKIRESKFVGVDLDRLFEPWIQSQFFREDNGVIERVVLSL